MEELHAAIAAHLRQLRLSASPISASPTPPFEGGRDSFKCRFCARRVREGGAGFHFAELWAAVSCATCHRDRLDAEAAAGGPGALRQGWYSARDVRPHCRRCGRSIYEVTGSAEERRQRAARICAQCEAAG